MRWPAWHRYIGALQEHYASSLSRRQFFTIVGLFWVYVTLSNVLYAYGMRTGIAKVTSVPLFAPWDARVLQHLLSAAAHPGVLLGIDAHPVAAAARRAAAADHPGARVSPPSPIRP